MTGLVSIITPTIPERYDLLVETMRDVRRQCYSDLEHIIVLDADDDDLAFRARLEVIPMSRFVSTRVASLGRRWSPLFPEYAIGVAPLLTGFLMARGEYLAWNCDDERLEPSCISEMVDALEATGSDFAYPKVRMWPVGTSPERGYTIGTDPPQYGQFTWCVFRASLLTKAMPRFDADTFNDFDLATRWMAAGARHVFVPRVLVSHRADR